MFCADGHYSETLATKGVGLQGRPGLTMSLGTIVKLFTLEAHLFMKILLLFLNSHIWSPQQ